MSSLLHLDDLTLRYDDTTVAVDRFGTTFEGPQIHGLLGRNGSGKTSLLSVMAGFRKPTAGTVTLDGQPVFENPTAVRQICLIRGSGDTIENDWPDDRGRDALAFAAALRPHWDQAFADELVERLGVPIDKRVGELSRGQRSGLGIVLGLAARAPITMLDESYLGLDAPSRYEFYDALLADYIAHPRTIVISTHLIEEVSSLFETVTIIDRGRLVLQTSAEDLREGGAAVTGPADVVARFTDDLQVLATTSLGPTRRDTVLGPLSEQTVREATDLGLELGPVPIQDLFVHLTRPTGNDADNETVTEAADDEAAASTERSPR